MSVYEGNIFDSKTVYLRLIHIHFSNQKSYFFCRLTCLFTYSIEVLSSHNSRNYYNILFAPLFQTECYSMNVKRYYILFYWAAIFILLLQIAFILEITNIYMTLFILNIY